MNGIQLIEFAKKHPKSYHVVANCNGSHVVVRATSKGVKTRFVDSSGKITRTIYDQSSEPFVTFQYGDIFGRNNGEPTCIANFNSPKNMDFGVKMFNYNKLSELRKLIKEFLPMLKGN